MYLVRFSLIQLTQIHKNSTVTRQTTEKQKQGEVIVSAVSTPQASLIPCY